MRRERFVSRWLHTHQGDGHGQHAVALVVDVLADQVHAPRRAHEQLRRRAKLGRERLGEALEAL